MQWFKENGIFVIVALCVTASIMMVSYNNTRSNLAAIEARKVAAETRASEGFKFKFGITKEKE